MEKESEGIMGKGKGKEGADRKGEKWTCFTFVLTGKCARGSTCNDLHIEGASKTERIAKLSEADKTRFQKWSAGRDDNGFLKN